MMNWWYCKYWGRSDEKVSKPSEEKYTSDNRSKRASDRQRNRRIRQTRRLTSEQNRNSKCSSAGKLLIVIVGLRSLHSERTALVFLLFASFECNNFLITKGQTDRGMDKKRMTKWWKRYCCISPESHFCLTWRPCCKEGRGDNMREAGARKW